MRIALSRLSWLVTGVCVFGWLTAETPALFRTAARASVVERFLSGTGEQLVSYRAVRRLTAASRGGRMQASLTALTTFESGGRLPLRSGGEETESGMIRIPGAACRARGGTRDARQRRGREGGAVGVELRICTGVHPQRVEDIRAETPVFAG